MLRSEVKTIRDASAGQRPSRKEIEKRLDAKPYLKVVAKLKEL